jgi:hypothetical protein
MMRLSKTRILIGVIVIIGLTALTCISVLLFYPAAGSRTYPDFRRFASEAELETYFRQNLPLTVTNKSAVEEFLQREGVANCWSFQTTGAGPFTIRCHLLAPPTNNGDGWYGERVRSIVIRSTYRVDFEFREDVLLNISVDYQEVGL